MVLSRWKTVERFRLEPTTRDLESPHELTLSSRVRDWNSLAKRRTMSMLTTPHKIRNERISIHLAIQRRLALPATSLNFSSSPVTVNMRTLAPRNCDRQLPAVTRAWACATTQISLTRSV